MDQRIDTQQQKTAVPQTKEQAPGKNRQEAPFSLLTPVLQTIQAGLPARILPPAALLELAALLGNSVMETLLEGESPGPALTSPRLGAPIGGSAREVSPGIPELTSPPRCAELTPLSGPGNCVTALRASGEGIGWPAVGGETLL